MLADAFAAERLRFFKARGVMFWSLGFVPLVGILFAVISAVLIRIQLNEFTAKAGPAAAEVLRQPVSLVKPILESTSGSNFFLVQIFFLIAGSAILAGDYRWETWRQLTPRNTRTNLLLAKLAMFGLVSAVGILLLALGGLVGGLISGVITGGGVQWAAPGEPWLKPLAGLYLIAWLEMMALGALAAVVAVTTRAGLAAMLVPVGVWIAQALLLSRLSPTFADPMQPPLVYVLSLPTLAADHLKAALSPPMPGFVPPTDWPIAFGALILWIAALTALAVWLFKRQDLTRE